MGDNDGRELSFEFALWTRDMVPKLIRREFSVALPVVSVGGLLKTMGLSPQRPLWKAWQQDRAAVEWWKAEQFPAIPGGGEEGRRNDLLRGRGGAAL